MDMELLLTADCIGVLKCGEEARINADVEVLVGLELIIPRNNAISNPVSEVIADDGIKNVDEELFRQLDYLLLLRQVLHHIRHLLGLIEDDLLGQGLVLWHGQVADAVVENDYEDG